MPSPPPRRGRPTGQTGRGLLAVAREVFLERGFGGASVDEVARRAGISKSSLYREHPSKSALFSAVVSDWVAAGRDSMRPALDRLVASGDAREGLRELAATIRSGVLSPPVLQMRRLVTSEAQTHPDVAAAYLVASWERNIAALGDALHLMSEEGRLHVTKPYVAAEQLTWLVVGAPLNALLLTSDFDAGVRPLDDAVDLFLARYGPLTAPPLT